MHRGQTGLEPRKLFNVVEFMMHDKDSSGTIDMDECMEILFRRFGKDQLEERTNEFFKHDTDGDNAISFAEFQKCAPARACLLRPRLLTSSPCACLRAPDKLALRLHSSSPCACIRAWQADAGHPTQETRREEYDNVNDEHHVTLGRQGWPSWPALNRQDQLLFVGIGK